MSLCIALLSEHASPLSAIGGTDVGGQNIAVAELACQLARQGHRVDVFTRRDRPDQPPIIDWQPPGWQGGAGCGVVRVVHVQAGPLEPIAKEKLLPFMDAFAQQMGQFIQNQPEPYDLIHSHFFMSGYVACQLKAQLGIPVVITFHALGEVRKQVQSSADHFPANRCDLEKQAIEQANAVVALCPQDYDDLRQLYGANPSRLTIIPNGFNPDQFYPVDRTVARLLINETTGTSPARLPIILFVGRVVPRKGIENVIRALGHLKRLYRVVARLIIVGGEGAASTLTLNPELNRLRQLAQDEGVDEWVTFTGSRKQEELRYYYSAADVFVTTPLYEPFGITPLEAMACGTPVIGSRVSGIKHTVLDNETGFLVPPNQPKVLAAKLAVLLHCPKLRLLLGQEALRHVSESYTWERVGQQTAELYERVLANRPIPGPLAHEPTPDLFSTDLQTTLFSRGDN